MYSHPYKGDNKIKDPQIMTETIHDLKEIIVENLESNSKTTQIDDIRWLAKMTHSKSASISKCWQI